MSIEIYYLTGYEKYNQLLFPQHLVILPNNKSICPFGNRSIVKFLYRSKILPKGKCLPVHLRGSELVYQLKFRKWLTVYDSLYYDSMQLFNSLFWNIAIYADKGRINQQALYFFPIWEIWESHDQLVAGSKVYASQNFINISLLVLSVMITISCCFIDSVFSIGSGYF